MTRRTPCWAVVVLFASFSGCGGEGDSTSLSLSATSVTFTGSSGTAPPPAQTIHVTFKGDGLVVGYPTGVAPPTWLAVSDLGHTATTADISLQVSDTATPGTRTTTLRFATGKTDGSQIKLVDVQVTWTVTAAPPAFAPFGATAPALTFSALGGSGQRPEPAAGYAVSIAGDRARWRASAPPWISLSQTSGSGPATLTLTSSAEGLTAGLHQGTIVIDDDASGGQKSFDVAIAVRAPRPVVEQVSPFAVDAGTSLAALIRQIGVLDEIGGTSPEWAVSWSVESVSADWLQWSPASGTSFPPAAITLTVDETKLPALDNGIHEATVFLSWSNAEVTGQTLAVPVSLHLCLPRADRVGPYVAAANQTGQMFVRGTGFACVGAAPTLLLGGAPLAYQIDADTQIQADVPALPAGRYPLRFDNNLGIELGTAELVVVSPPAFAYQAISAPGARSRLVYDAERAILYGVNPQSIERYALSASNTFGALDPIAVPDLQDVDLAPDGRSLIVAAKDSLGEVDLGASTPSFVQRATNPDSFCGGHFAQLAVPNSGRAFVVFKLADCTGFTDSYLYDLRTHALAKTTSLFSGVAAAPADGSVVYLGSNGVTPEPQVFVYDALNDAATTGAPRANLSAISANRDASRVIFQGVDVYSRTLSLLGHLSAGRGALAARDTKKAFVYRDDGAAGPRLDLYDLNAPVTGGLFPVKKTFLLPDLPNTEPGGPVQMAPTPGDTAVFVSGNARILVVPVG
jgi:hypothetical protein